MDEKQSTQEQLPAPVPGHGPEQAKEHREGRRRISRRAFIGLAIAGAAALAVGGRQLVVSTRSHTGTEPGAFNINDFGIRSVAEGPNYKPDQWRLTVSGMVKQDLSLSLDKFLALPQVDEVREFDCVEGWTVHKVPWEGVTVREIMARADIKPEAKYIVFWSDDLVYSDVLPVELALKPEVMLAHKLGGNELNKEQGWPVRLVVPGNYGYKYVKWVGRVVVTDQPHVGYWERFGYPDDATVAGT
jgi:DMSO/TMAO reductase YedYZ molybdopterin-dependent catalytic subunit